MPLSPSSILGGTNNAIASRLTSLSRNLAGPQPTSGDNKGLIYNHKLGISILFQKNPEKITEEMADNWTFTEVQGQADPLMSFACRGAKRKRFNILIDAHSTPHRLGHIGQDLYDIEMLTIPHDKAGLPIALPARYGHGGTHPSQQSNEVIGVPPIVRIIYGGRFQKGFITNLTVEETLHGTTEQSKPQALPTRATVTFDWVIIDDMRMLISYKETLPS